MAEQSGGEINGSTVIQNTCFEDDFDEKYFDTAEHIDFNQCKGDDFTCILILMVVQSS